MSNEPMSKSDGEFFNKTAPSVRFLDTTTLIYCGAFFLLMVFMEIVMERLFKEYRDTVPADILANSITW